MHRHQQLENEISRTPLRHRIDLPAAIIAQLTLNLTHHARMYKLWHSRSIRVSKRTAVVRAGKIGKALIAV